ncbi:MAG: lamin tail domain-containing protein [Bacteroidia bacterium]|nr:lamin tail domain-containing protein [Bacteroidia bacterium]
MIKKYALFLIVFLCLTSIGYGQCLTDDFNSGYGNWTESGTYQNGTAGVTGNGTGFNSTGDEIITTTVLTNPDVITFWLARSSSTENKTFSIQYSLSNTGPWTTVRDILNGEVTTTHQEFTTNLGLTGDYYIRLAMTQRTGGSYYLDDITVTCSAGCSDAMDYANIQFPTASPQNITVGDAFDVYTQAVEPGVTNANATAPGIGVEAWIGYSTTNDDPGTGTGWNWIVANYNTDVGANDEFVAEIGSGLPVGTYYYASRYRLNGCDFTYGGTGGNWSNDSVQLNVNPHVLDWCNLQSPPNGAITTGSIFDVYGQVYELGVTDTPGAQGANIEGWIGYSTADTDPSGGGWTWIVAGYNNLCGANCGTPENNDEYFVDIGSGLSAGTYYYASRFRIDNDVFYYGGYNPGGGGFWDGIANVNGVLTITDPIIADVVITEIMYNTTGIDDEWIEICNISGSTQDISNYIIDVGGTTEFTFPASTLLADGVCITIDIGDGGGSEYNVDCPFTPDYSSGSGNGTLSNTNPETITLYAANGSTVADVVTFDDSDGADGNTASLHVTDATMDNSNANTNWQEVIDGGTPGSNTLISSCTPLIPEINVEGVIGGFPDIMDEDVTPQGTDNTLFAQQIIGNSQLKSYRIQNLGAVNLIVDNIYINGPGGELADFTVGTYSYPITIAPGADFTFDITFSPLGQGPRNATLYIDNNDADEDPYNFAIQGSGICAAGAISISPTSGPAGTIVTVTGSNFGTVNTSASIDGFAVAVTYISPTVIEVTIPAGADADNLEITDESNCLAISFFTVLTSDVTNCEGASGVIPPNWNDLLITGVYDNSSGSCHYLELFNPTGSPIVLTGNYEIGLSNNFATTTSTPFTFNAGREPLDGTVQPFTTYVVRFGNQGDTCNDCPTIVPDETIEDPGFGINGNSPDGVDRIVLIKNFVNVDLWGNNLYGSPGYVYTRSPEDGLGNPVTTTAPTMSWDTNDWASQGTADCFAFQYVPASPPMVNTNPSYTPDCNILTATLSVSATEGYNLGDDTQELAYQWYYSMPGDPGWTAVTNNATYSGATTVNLTISDILNTVDFQFYCQIREDDSSCSTASDAIRIDVPRTIWYFNGTVVDWSDGAPTTGMIAVIDEDYNTVTNGNIDACNLVVYVGRNFSVGNSSYVRVVNNVVNNGTITVETQGSFVQDGNGGLAGTFTNNGAGIANVSKHTATFDSNISEINYTYWSSPVNDPSNSGFGEDISTVFPTPVGNRKYYFRAQNYIDSFIETNNNNDVTTNPGQDDIDDNFNDWMPASGALEIGRGYAVTTSGLPPTPGNYSDNSTVFSGAFNTGDITVPLYKNNNEVNDNNWNFIGNPYPSAISVDDFFSANVADVPLNPPVNTLTEGAIFLWSQSQPADALNNGNENLNFAQSDYAIINRATQTAGTSGTLPLRFIPSGQGFFVAYTENLVTPVNSVTSGNVVFTNSMRRTLNNTQFFEAFDNSQNFNPIASNNANEKNVLWLNLISDNGVFSQIAIAYVNGATNEYDGWSYDTPRNLSTGTYAALFSVIDSSDRQFAIQGKSPESLNLNEVVPLGFYTSIDEATLYTISIAQLEGEFLETNSIFVKDYLMNITHNLSDSDYVFTSDVGDFRERFEIVFTEDALSLGENEFDPNDLSIIELSNGDVKFKLNGNHLMQRIEIIDLLGRSLYILDAEDSSDNTYNLSNLSQAAYIAKVTLDNGYIITKKAVKRK